MTKLSKPTLDMARYVLSVQYPESNQRRTMTDQLKELIDQTINTLGNIRMLCLEDIEKLRKQKKKLERETPPFPVQTKKTKKLRFQ